MASWRAAVEALSLRSELADLGRFLRAPRRTPVRHASNAPWSARLLLIAVLTIAAATLVDVATSPIVAWAGLESTLPERVTPGFLFAALLFAPVGEELLFRAGLRQALYTLAIGPPLLVFAIAPWTKATFAALAVWLVVALLIGRVLARRVFARPGGRFAFGRGFVMRYRWTFWLYTLAFALMHIGNYSGSGARVGVVPLLVLPQLVIGISLGWLRLRDGLRSSMLLHLLVNAAALTGLALTA